MNQAADILFQLLKVALGNSSSCDFPTDKVNWNAVKMLAQEQGVLGVAFDAFETLPVTRRPDEDCFLDWMGQVCFMESTYESYEWAIAELGRFCESQKVPVLLMKGWGCSLNYCNPKHRPCGDIDILLGKYKVFIEQIISQKGIKINYANEHHAVFAFNGFTVESHETVLDANSHKSNGYLNQILDQLALDSISNSEKQIGLVLPSDKFNSIHLLRHMASDFAEVRTSLRHVIDWSTFVTKNCVDWDFVHDVAHRANMHRFLDAVNGICVHVLGYPEDKFPIEHRSVKLESRVLNEILTCSDTAGIATGISLIDKIGYGIRKTGRMVKNRWKYRIVFDESLLTSFIWKARNRWEQ